MACQGVALCDCVGTCQGVVVGMWNGCVCVRLWRCWAPGCLIMMIMFNVLRKSEEEMAALGVRDADVKTRRSAPEAGTPTPAPSSSDKAKTA